jgi:hypothetical protein
MAPMRLLGPISRAAVLIAAAMPCAAESVDLELVLAADASGSIDSGEIRLQREGYAAAITDPEILQALRDRPRLAFGRNAIGSVIDFSQRQIEGNTHEGERKVIDVSADSAWSWNGMPLQLARDRAIQAGITINGLAVLCRTCSGRPTSGDLEGDFTRRIIGGPASFVITADGNTSFAEAVRKKLLLEIAGATPGREKRLAAR